MDVERLTHDMYELDRDWSEEQQAIINQCRRFVDNEILPTINADHAAERLPENIYEKSASWESSKRKQQASWTRFPMAWSPASSSGAVPRCEAF